MTAGAEVYLDDGVYVRFDGYTLWLRAPREGGDHLIALEPAGMRLLISFAQRAWGRPL